MNYKVLLYTEMEKASAVSGLGKAIKHQEQALKENNVPFTRNKRSNYDIVHINFYGPRSYFLAKKARRKGKKVVYHAHSTEEDFRNSFIFSNQIAPLFKKWIVTCYKLGDVILTPTPYSRELLLGYGLKNIVPISNGVDTEFFRKDKEAGKKFRAKYGYKDDDKVIVGIGLFLERKGILDFVDLARRMPEYQFIWFGNTPKAIIPHKIRSAIRTAPRNVKFPGHVDAKMIRAALSGADLYIFPTFEETEGIPILEAMACKQQAIVRDIPVFKPWLEDGKNVYMAKNVNDFEKKIKLVLSGKLEDLTEAGRKTAETCDIRKTGKALIKIYDDLFKEKA